jgi:hypothetical protein
MTAAERQRRCRARGKGRHRGGPTPGMVAESRMRVREVLAAAQPTAEPTGEPTPAPQVVVKFD